MLPTIKRNIPLGNSTDSKKIKDIAIRTSGWWFINLGYGLLPLWLVVIAKTLPLNDQSIQILNKEWLHILHDGAINFFCLAILGSIGTDVYLSKIVYSNLFRTGIIIGAILPLFCLVIVFLAMIFGGTENTGFGTIVRLRWGICIYTFLYSTWGKTVMFNNEKN